MWTAMEKREEQVKRRFPCGLSACLIVFLTGSVLAQDGQDEDRLFEGLERSQPRAERSLADVYQSYFGDEAGPSAPESSRSRRRATESDPTNLDIEIGRDGDNRITPPRHREFPGGTGDGNRPDDSARDHGHEHGSGGTGDDRLDPVDEDPSQEPTGRRYAEYEVVRGDTLWGLADRYYKDGFRWKDIYLANDYRIDNPNLIFPGQVFRIPLDDPAPSKPRPSKPDPEQWPIYSDSFQDRDQYSSYGKSGGSLRVRHTRYPVPSGRITSDFGPRWGRYHGGQDIAVPNGTPVRATAPGRIIFTGWKGGYGRTVQILHQDGSITTYAHLKGYTKQNRRWVNAGDTVALSNNSGHSTGPHLHFAVSKNGRFLDPRRIIDFPRKGRRF